MLNTALNLSISDVISDIFAASVSESAFSWTRCSF